MRGWGCPKTWASSDLATRHVPEDPIWTGATGTSKQQPRWAELEHRQEGLFLHKDGQLKPRALVSLGRNKCRQVEKFPSEPSLSHLGPRVPSAFQHFVNSLASPKPQCIPPWLNPWVWEGSASPLPQAQPTMAAPSTLHFSLRVQPGQESPLILDLVQFLKMTR